MEVKGWKTKIIFCTGIVRTFMKIITMSNSATLIQSRFDVRLPRAQKEVIELAATLSGFKSKSEFIVHTLFKEATSIVVKHTQIIASEKDQKLFFDAIINPPKPNKNLLKAAKNYNKLVAIK
jgi:uncharacterized protein (DUF1778 family)